MLCYQARAYQAHIVVKSVSVIFAEVNRLKIDVEYISKITCLTGRLTFQANTLKGNEYLNQIRSHRLANDAESIELDIMKKQRNPIHFQCGSQFAFFFLKKKYLSSLPWLLLFFLSLAAKASAA